MSPHRLLSVRHYRIPDDVLIKVLELLDPPTLWRACKAFRRIYSLVMDYQPLRYKFELAVSGMKDGPVGHSRAPPYVRLQLLLNYRRDWPRLEWTHEHQLPIPVPALIGFSGGFIHQIRSHGVFNTLDLTQLPSCRTNVPPSHTRHLRYTTGEIENVAVDFSQALIVMSHIFSHHGQIGFQLHFRDLWSFEKHHRAHGVIYEMSAQVSTRVTQVALSVCGSKMAMSIEFHGGRIRHIVVDWRTFVSRWFEDQDIQLLDENFVLSITKKNGHPFMNLYNIAHLPNATLVREYELPEAWKNCIIGFCPNTSAKTEFSVCPDALFFAAPENRLVVVIAKSASHSRIPLCNWLFISESLIKTHYSKDRSVQVSWCQWAQYCLIKDVGNMMTNFRGPYSVGTRVVYLEVEHGHHLPRLHVIDFAPFSDVSIPSWFWIGPRALLVPYESSRTIPHATFNGQHIEDIRPTEDNIILFSEAKRGCRMATVLTFGAHGRSYRH